MHVYSVLPSSGEERRLVTLTLPKPVIGVMLGAAGSNLYVMLVAADSAAPKSLIRISAVRAEDGKILWEKNEQLATTRPGGLLQARPDRLIYSMDREVYMVSADKGDLDKYLVESQAVIPVRSTSPSDSDEWVYWVTADQALTAYNLERKQAWRFQVPDLEPNRFPCTCRVSGQILYDFDRRAVFAVDLRPEMHIRWRMESPAGKSFESLFLGEGRLFAYRDDGMLLELDPANGQTLRQYPFLWQPDSSDIVGDVAYVFTSGHAYAMKLPK